MSKIALRLGECVLRMADMPDECVGWIITDPPYGLSFMGVAWDTYAHENREFVLRGNIQDKMGKVCNPHSSTEQSWVRGRQNRSYAEFSLGWLRGAYRVLKPGGQVMAFSGSRTHHRLAAAMEQAGFVDMRLEAWNYSNGFPKNHPIAVYMDRMLTEGRSREIIRKGVGNLNGRFADAVKDFESQSKAHTVTSPEALPWVGWGTAMKPAWEPVLVGMKSAKEV